MHAQRIVLAARPQGEPKLSDFALENFSLSIPEAGEVCVETEYLSLDPYMRGRMDARKSYSSPIDLGCVMPGEAVARIMSSRHLDFQPGDLVLGRLGWTTHAVSKAAALVKLDARFSPVTTALGVLGMPGFTAYVGLLNIGRPHIGETVVVAAASGPVGSLVGQIARIHGARAVGIAGGSEKCAFVRDELRFDASVDHRSADFAERLAAACPSGIDVYFENVGGHVWQTVLPLLNNHARIPVCGLIADYNGPATNGPDRLPATMREVLARRLSMTGFINSDFAQQRPEFLNDVSSWIAEGRIRYREDTIKGLENAPLAFVHLLQGKIFGKLIIDLTRVS